MGVHRAKILKHRAHINLYLQVCPYIVPIPRSRLQENTAESLSHSVLCIYTDIYIHTRVRYVGLSLSDLEWGVPGDRTWGGSLV